MFSKLLIKLIDQAILPALLLFTARVVSIVLISRYLSIDYTITASGFTFLYPKDYITVNSYSLLAMTSVLFLGLCYILIKAYLFHDTHIHPGTTAKLFSYKLSHLIQDSYYLYTQGAVWLSYGFLLTLVSGVLLVYGFIFRWVFNLSLGITLLSTVLFILDVENEIKIAKKIDPEYDIDWSDHLEEGESENA